MNIYYLTAGIIIVLVVYLLRYLLRSKSKEGIFWFLPGIIGLLFIIIGSILKNGDILSIGLMIMMMGGMIIWGYFSKK